MQVRAPAGSPSLLRRHNSKLILDAIRAEGPISRAALARAVGLSKPTVNQVAELLLAQGFVVEEMDGPGAAPRRPGPRARLLRFRAEVGHVLGLDVGAGKARALLADLSGRIVATAQRTLDGPPRRDALLDLVEATARDVLDQLGDGALRVAGVGTPGVVDPASGRISLAPQIEGWDGLNLGGELEDRLGCPAVVDNETRLSLLAETWRGTARGVDNVAYVQVGIGIGGAVLVDGRLVRGKSGAAGEIAYLLDADDGADGHRERREASGPFEHAAGGRAYARLGAEAARGAHGDTLRRAAGGDPGAVDARTVFAAAAAGDRAATDIVARLTARLGRGVANLATVLDPDLVVLGGGVANAGPALLDPVAAAVLRAVPSPPRVVLTELGDDGVALGAVRRAIDVADELLFAFHHVGA